MIEIRKVQQASGVTKLQLANKIDFEYKNLSLGVLAQSFINKGDEVFTYLGHCDVESNAIGEGAHHILQGAGDKHFLINNESFDLNFKAIVFDNTKKNV
jgi:hypothetical protein